MSLYCFLDKDPCDPDPCGPQGTCEGEIGEDFDCECEPGFFGHTCEECKYIIVCLQLYVRHSIKI